MSVGKFFYFITIGWIIALLELIFGLIGVVIAGSISIVVGAVALAIFIGIIVMIGALIVGAVGLVVPFIIGISIISLITVIIAMITGKAKVVRNNRR